MANNNNNRSITRKPLSDISNGGAGGGVKLKSNLKKITSSHKQEEIPVKIKEEEKEEDDYGDGVLDRLLLTHSDLSNLIHQIDELVVEAFKVKLKSRKERKEVESFTHVLSDIHSSLKAWVPRFQQALSSPSVVPDHQIGESSPSESTPTVYKESSGVSGSAEQLDLDTLVSPSPLVSWHAEHIIEDGRQLFLLTPLPRSKALSSMRCRSTTSTSVFERFTDLEAPPNTTLGLPSLRTISADTSDDLLEGVVIKPTPKNVFGSFNKKDSAVGSGFISTPKVYNRNKSTFLVSTPGLKSSPPKSCVLLEPISESFHHNFNNNRKLTPFPVRREISSPSEISESSSSFASESLALKYPELFGTRQTNSKSGAWMKQVDASLDTLLMSPPKSCVLMEPPIEKYSMKGTGVYLSNFRPVLDERLPCAAAPAARKQDLQGAFEANTKYLKEEPLLPPNANTSLVESTPMWKEPDSAYTGKRRGENTLKRELWTRFEAASSNALHFDLSAFPETPTKGFLDRLEEVSCDK
ncbi:hypothetical protein MKW94_006895 [Papaver nudicaule]|uniref:Uncharacterized protein n=1 Tax=Papaver nudicaule TaxID=74823 RepID=A0AA41SEP7_PAPNU|nr:hypothetical protein [Papaver nudicaule]